MATRGSKFKEGAKLKIEGSLEKHTRAELRKLKKRAARFIESATMFETDLKLKAHAEKELRMINGELRRRDKHLTGAKTRVKGKK